MGVPESMQLMVNDRTHHLKRALLDGALQNNEGQQSLLQLIRHLRRSMVKLR